MTRTLHRRFKRSGLTAMFLVVLLAAPVSAEEVGRVDTRFRALSPDDTIRVEVFADPKVDGVACYLSKAHVGGYGGALGISEDTSDGSIECVQVGPIRFKDKFEEGESVFKERRSLLFKSMKVIRFCDESRNALVYLVYSERFIDGSPKNSVTAVPIRAWAGEPNSGGRCQYQP